MEERRWRGYEENLEAYEQDLTSWTDDVPTCRSGCRVHQLLLNRGRNPSSVAKYECAYFAHLQVRMLRSFSVTQVWLNSCRNPPELSTTINLLVSLSTTIALVTLWKAKTSVEEKNYLIYVLAPFLSLYGKNVFLTNKNSNIVFCEI